jgi:hypothetical protein
VRPNSPAWRKQRIVLFAQQIQRRLRKFQQARRVAGSFAILLHPFLFCSGCNRAEVISCTWKRNKSNCCA